MTIRKNTSANTSRSRLKTISCVGLGCFLMALCVAACAPKVGSQAWCERQEATPKLDWSPRDAADYAKHCVFK